MPPKIIISQQMYEQARAAILQVAPDAEFVTLDKEGLPQGDVSDADIYLRAWISPDANRKIIQAAHNLRWMHTFSAGVDHLLAPEVVERDIVLTNASGVHSDPIAEWVMLYILSTAKRFPTFIAAQQKGEWLRNIELDELADRTLLIVGLGSIGAAVAKRAVGFGLRIWGVQRTPRPDDPDNAHIEKIWGDDWRDALPEADYVVIGLPLTAATRHMFGADEIGRMKKTAWLVNIARGEIIDDDALLTALRDGRIGGAALDAFDPEPLPAGHPYYSLPNVVVTPHMTWNSPGTTRRSISLFLDNLRRYLDGQELRNIVDKSAGY